MADHLSITASIVGIIGRTLHGTRLLLDDLQKLIDASDTVQRLKDDLHLVDAAVTSLKAIEEREWEALGVDIVEKSTKTLGNLQRACDSFRTDVQHWTRHSKQGKCQRVWCRVTKRLDCYQRSSLVYAMSVTSLISAFLSFVIASPFIFLRRFPPLVGSTALSAFLPIGA
jgi:hypothetical protein